jgi:hypothetical protein
MEGVECKCMIISEPLILSLIMDSLSMNSGVTEVPCLKDCLVYY